MVIFGQPLFSCNNSVPKYIKKNPPANCIKIAIELTLVIVDSDSTKPAVPSTVNKPARKTMMPMIDSKLLIESIL